MTWFRRHRFLQRRVPAIPPARLRRAGQFRCSPKYAYIRIVDGFLHGERLPGALRAVGRRQRRPTAGAPLIDSAH
jgi:hypothetical protein